MLPGWCCIAIAALELGNGDSWYHMCAFRFHFWGRKMNWNQASHVRASSVCIEYFPEALYQKKGKTNSKYKNAPVLDNSCRSQKAYYRKTQNGQVPHFPNWSISYYFLYKKEFFSLQRGPPHECYFPQCIFHVKCHYFVRGLAHRIIT